jgi:hypothetical protein
MRPHRYPISWYRVTCLRLSLTREPWQRILAPLDARQSAVFTARTRQNQARRRRPRSRDPRATPLHETNTAASNGSLTYGACLGLVPPHCLAFTGRHLRAYPPWSNSTSWPQFHLSVFAIAIRDRRALSGNISCNASASFLPCPPPSEYSSPAAPRFLPLSAPNFHRTIRRQSGERLGRDDT